MFGQLSKKVLTALHKGFQQRIDIQKETLIASTSNPRAASEIAMERGRLEQLQALLSEVAIEIQEIEEGQNVVRD